MQDHNVRLPSMGEGIIEATVVKWLKKVGEQVTKDEPLVEVATDKVDTELASPFTGKLTALMAENGAIVAVDSTICTIQDSNSNLDSDSAKDCPDEKQKPAKGQKNPYSQPISVSAPNENFLIKSSPLVRKIAKEKGIQLSHVRGTGIRGRICKKDIDQFLADSIACSLENSPVLQSQVQATTQTALATKNETAENQSLQTTTENGQEFLEGVAVIRKPMTRMRQLIADHMSQSIRKSPHVTTVFEVDMHQLVNLRAKMQADFSNQEGFKLTYTPFFIHAAVAAIRQFPELNTSIDGYDILEKKDINIGVAVALPSGLIVPVIKKAGELSLLGIARKMNDLVERARGKKLLPTEVTGGTFTITNPGGYGSLTSNPIINQPQVAILGIGAIVKRPVVINDLIGVRPLMLVSLTFDHRVVDGEGGALFLAALKKNLELNYSSLSI